MNKRFNKIIKNLSKKILYIFIIFSFIFSSTPFGFFEYIFDNLRKNNIVDQMWLSENSNNVIDSFSVKEASAAEVIIESDITDSTDDFGPSPTVVFTTNQTGYLFFVDAGNDLAYRKTTNGGTNWATPVVIDNTLTGWTTVSVWYDQWTPGDTSGTKVHIAAADNVTGDAYYTYLDTNGDTLKGSVVSVIPQTTFTAEANAAPSITKGRGGDLFLTANFATTAGGYVYKSSDGSGNTWTNITPFGWSSVSLDQIQLLPLYIDNDIIAIKAETTSNAIKYQVYDEFLDSWAGTWTNIGSLTEHATYDQWFSATVNKTNGNIYLSFNNYTNNAGNDLEFWSFSDSTRMFTKKTDIRSNSAQLLSPVPLVDENTGDVYVAYIEGQTNFVYNGMGVNSITYIYYQKTMDGGDTWGSRQGVLTSDVGDDYKFLRGNISSTSRLFVAYYDDDDDDIWGTTIYSSSVPVEANIDTAIVDATDEFSASPSSVFLDEDIGYQFYTRTNVMLDATDEFGASPSVVFTDVNTGYIFFIDSPSQDLVYRKTVDGGITWSGSNIIDTNITGWTSVSVWYDQWTPGDTTGTKINITASDDASDDIYYTYLDTNGDNLKGNMVMAVSGTTTLTEAVDGPPTITKGAEGYLFIAGNFTSTTGGKVSKSIDGSGNIWTNITPAGWSSSAVDQIQLLPLLTDNDILAIRADTANNDMDYQVYDEVSDSWAGTWTTIGTIVDNATYDQWFSATLKKTTGDVYLTFTNSIGVATGDIEFWTFSNTSRTFIKSAIDVVSNLATILTPVPFYKEDTGTIYVAYTRGTLAGTMHVYFKSSTDGGASWSTESAALSTTGDDFKGLRGNMMSSSNLYVAWYNDDTNVIKGDRILSIQSYDLPITGVQSVVYRKTINGGGEWGPPYTIANMVGATSVSVWYDQWTPGDNTGTKIHIAFSDDQTDDHYYSSFDTSNNKIIPPIPVLLGTTITEAVDGPTSITKGGGGDLFISGNFTTTAGGKVSKSSNGGSIWTDITPSGWSTVAVDQIQLLPLSTNDDIIAIKAETANNSIKYQVYDEVANSWAGTWTTIGTIVENTTYDQWFSASLKKSSGDIYLTFANYTNNAANDIEFWNFLDNTRTFSKGTDVYSNTANAVMPTTLIDESSGDIYVAYLRGTLAATMNVYYKKSSDGGSTWSVESQTLSPGIYDDVMALRGNLLSDKRLYVFWYNDDLNDIYGNTVAKIEVPLISYINQASFRFFENLDSFNVGSPLSILNTAATLLSSYNPEFRLRLILSVLGKTLSLSEENLKLQFSLKSGDCDSLFLGETYEDVSHNTNIAYYDNSSSDNGLIITTNIDDPTDVSVSNISPQSYVESNNFTNSIGQILGGEGGLWDFSLHYRGITSEQSYCFRVVKENGDLLNIYPEILPEITTAQYRSRGGGGVHHIEEVETPDGEVGGGDSEGGEEIILPLCSDTLDNDADTYIDILDLGCHMDGNINNAYVPEWNSETTAPVSETGGGSGDTGGDLGFINKNNFINFPDFSKFKNLLLAMVFNVF
jgi:hypothetical protein